ncbi:MAG: hypothetical protein ACE5Z5_03480 [Candidatus Bathyarchaeia archaeon]
MRKPSKEDLDPPLIEAHVRLFEYVMAVGDEIGEERAWEILEGLVTKKRLRWLDENRDILRPTGSEVERAYDAFLIKYLGLNREEVPIVERSETRIVYRSYNYCPTLEACKRLGLDTREVCRRAYEKPVEAFLKAIDPRLRFGRNYERIRPYAEFCEEVIWLEAKPSD